MFAKRLLNPEPLLAPLRKGELGEREALEVFFFLVMLRRNLEMSGIISALLSVLRRAERHGSAKSFSVACVWLAGNPDRAASSYTGHTSTPLTMHGHLGAGDAWQSEHNDPDSMSCKVKYGFFFYTVPVFVWPYCSLLNCP